MISFYKKSTKTTNFEKPIKKFITNNYSSDDTELIMLEINNLERARNEIVKELTNETKSPNLEASVELYKNYYKKLHSISCSIPFEKSVSLIGKSKNNGAYVEFSWGDSFRETKKVNNGDVEHEKLCILFNIAVLTSNIAHQAARATDEGIKIATKNLLESASIFKYLASKTKSVDNESKSMDLTPNSLKFIAIFTKAEVQICFFEKAQSKKYSIRLISKLAMAVAEIYAKTELLLERDKELKLWIKKGDYPFHDHASAQKNLFLATAHFWMSKNDLKSKKYGEEITRLKLAKNYIDQTEEIKLKSLLPSIEKAKNSLKKFIDSELKRAIDENNSIYHLKVPEPNEIEVINGQILANLKDIDMKSLESSSENNIFKKLVPREVKNSNQNLQTAISLDLDSLITKSEQADIKYNYMLSDYVHLCKSTMQTTGGSASFEILSEIQKVRERGGINYIKVTLENINNTHENVQKELKGLNSSLKLAENKYKEYKKKYGNKWTMIPPEESAKQYYLDLEQIQKYLDDAEISNRNIKIKWKHVEPSIEYILTHSFDHTTRTAVEINDGGNTKNCMDKIDELNKNIKSLINKKNIFLFDKRKNNESADYSSKIIEIMKEEQIDLNDLNKIVQKIRHEKLEEIENEYNQNSTEIDSAIKELIRRGEDYESSGVSKSNKNEQDKVSDKYKNTVYNFSNIVKGFESGTRFYDDLKKLYMDVISAKIMDFLKQMDLEIKKKEDEINNNYSQSSYQQQQQPQQTFNNQFNPQATGYYNPNHSAYDSNLNNNFQNFSLKNNPQPATYYQNPISFQNPNQFQQPSQLNPNQNPNLNNPNYYIKNNNITPPHNNMQNMGYSQPKNNDNNDYNRNNYYGPGNNQNR